MEEGAHEGEVPEARERLTRPCVCASLCTGAGAVRLPDRRDRARRREGRDGVGPAHHHSIPGTWHIVGA